MKYNKPVKYVYFLLVIIMLLGVPHQQVQAETVNPDKYLIEWDPSNSKIDTHLMEQTSENYNKLYVTDSKGRALVLHGLNTANSAKGSEDGMPWISEKNVEQEAKEMGSNFVRFLIFWSHIEPQKGKYDEEYLNKVAERIDWYKKQGIHVLLDMHQDLYGPKVTGNGAPPWATYDDGLPVTPQNPWALTYLQPGVMRAFDNLWNDKNQIQQDYSNMWKHVAQRFADNDTVIGYDLMNEPFGGSNIWPFFEKNKLANMYQKVINTIRTVDQKHWVFYEPQAFGINQGLCSTLPKLHDPRQGEAKLGYAPHLYPLLLETNAPYTGITKSLVRNTIHNWRNNRMEESRNYGTPIILGEYGLDVTKEGRLDYVDDVIDMIDSIGSGFAYWSNDPGSWGPYDENGNFNALAERLARPYPRAIAGNPIDWKYDTNKNVLTVTWSENQNVAGPTELFLSPKYYPNGWEIKTNDPTDTEWSTQWDAERHILKIYTNSNHSNHDFSIIPQKSF
ncbi:cellulase family glycosylhydrolase [Bacillus wiedmannii]|uniref:cellulase family glycosylhydrolase n=1 Tax=Bacillus wiedmannii TaxID=1890302 RepID=UPI000B449F42|nr:hypothetical protein BK740_04370 [Bacillus thuringiensis serovar argentinensis]